MSEPLPNISFAEIAVGLFEDARYVADTNERLQMLTERLSIAGISDATRARILADAKRQADLSAAAHAWFKAMAEHESAIRALVGRHYVSINAGVAA